jgi:hypothetical protein
MQRPKTARLSPGLPGKSDCDVYKDQGRAMTEKACDFFLLLQTYQASF